ncbi:MerR family transcriptional regulator [Nocardioides pacificus]
MEHSISEVARLAGVSARTLRHYDDLGLLPPAKTSANGYRWYERPQLLRLQRILLLRELRVPLAQVGEIFDGETDEHTALQHHREQLLAERDRLDRIIDTVDRTMADLAGEQPVSDKDFFMGLAEGKARLHKALVDRYGAAVDSYFDAAQEATDGWAREDHERAAANGRRLLTQMSIARTRGVAPDGDEALDLVAEHHQEVVALWPADPAAYHALGDLLVDNPDQRALVADVDPQLPAWLAVAIKTYAVRRLGHTPT